MLREAVRTSPMEEEPDDVPGHGTGGAMAARKQLARILWEARRTAGVTQEQAAARLQRTTATLYKIENGLPGVRLRPHVEIRLLCELYEVTDAETISTLEALAAATRVKGPYQPYRDLISAELNIYLGLERDAIAMSTYESDLIPGLMQTADYARAIIQMPGSDGQPRNETEVRKRVKLRLARQDLLVRKPKALVFDVIIAETALLRMVDNAALMADQLRTINQIGMLPNVSVRVVRLGSGLHLGATTGQFILLRFPGDEPSILYSDGYLGDNFFKERKEIASYESAWADIGRHALNVEDSRSFIEHLAERFAE